MTIVKACVWFFQKRYPSMGFLVQRTGVHCLLQETACLPDKWVIFVGARVSDMDIIGINRIGFKACSTGETGLGSRCIPGVNLPLFAK